MSGLLTLTLTLTLTRHLVAAQLREWPPLVFPIILVPAVPHLERAWYNEVRRGEARQGRARQGKVRRGEAS